MTSKAVRTKEKAEVIPVEISKINVSDWNVRKKGIKQEEINELADSIRAVGLIQPVELMKRAGEDRFDLIVGQRRYLAHKKLGWKTIRSMVVDRLDEDEAVIHSLVENMHRKELNHTDAARATTELYKRFNKDIEKVHRVTGLSQKRIRQYVYIDELASAETKQELRAGRVKPADVQRALRAAQGNIEKADKMLEMMKEYQLDKHQSGRLVEYGEDHPKWSAKKIFEEATKPRVEKSVVVPLRPKLRDGLQKAVESCRRGPDEIAAEALEDWLRRNDYL